ncbi:MAG: DUF4835 family protein [Bacteroidota bacterium]
MTKHIFSCIVACFILLLAVPMQAQELDFEVSVNLSKLKGRIADPQVFKSLEQSIQEFMNSTKWTRDVFEPEERIKGNIVINISQEVSNTRFQAEMSIQAIRPVYNSGYETALITYKDKDIWFDYEQFQPIVFSENNYNDHISSLLAFYAYLVLGMDYDSFSPFGGQPYFQRAQEILNMIPTGVAGVEPQGWRATDGNRNRYWIVENLLSPRVRPYRQAMYDYHRHGLDAMADDPNSGKAMITETMESISKVNRSYPNAMLLQMFSDAKHMEIAEIFKGATQQEKNKMIQVMTRIDGSRSTIYRSVR